MKCKQNGELAKRYHAVMLTMILVAGAVLVMTMPTAAAHTCAAYSGCDATTCKDGEEHDHTDYNYVTRDERCTSHAKSVGTCQIGGQALPEPVCKLIAGNATDLVDTGKITSLPANPPGCSPKVQPSGGGASFAAATDPNGGCSTSRTGQFAAKHLCVSYDSICCRDAFSATHICLERQTPPVKLQEPSQAQIRTAEARFDLFEA